MLPRSHITVHKTPNSTSHSVITNVTKEKVKAKVLGPNYRCKPVEKKLLKIIASITNLTIQAS
jgi:hypothetical protein